ncbi:glycosyltransferase family 2 protein [Thiomicrorhabdus lithotrophica]|uniref:Glycosyltransferase family 2 protein n=1 Tax=Thiomicrorhabdus lithotrophica TaxID=2949997 RepID=A0ABY8C9B6_9GAMM|nr:glycosyltransferase family 2 protein [Thiomicrorhabdus lithotrophica]WEJ62127.1 glycosyltransferase family 2 protein [Thiomicrorhabdus lithotrophica]
MLESVKYFWQVRQPKSNQDLLVMTILCRNEVDIIEANIKTHSTLGVDGFVVMDNGSTDGTREKLAELTKQYNLHVIDQPSQTYQQAKWMKELAFYARDKMGARWVISNDADEFWIPENGDLKSYLQAQDSVVTVKRSNMLLTEKALTDDYHFSQAEHRVLYPICYDREVQKSDNQISMLLVPISPKVIVNPRGLIKLSGGNHRAKHVGKAFTARSEAGIHVYHYPIRTYSQFEANIMHREELLKLPNARMGDHYRRWVRIYQQGGLEQEFERFVLTQEQLSTFVEYRVAVKDNKVSKAILKALQ